MNTWKFVLVVVVALCGLVCARGEDAPKAADVDFKVLGFENNLFTFEGKPFSGVAIKKDKQGRLRGRYEYAEGRFDGLTQEWYTNGVKSAQTRFVRGMRHGTNEYFNTDGSLLKRQLWREDKLVESTDKHDMEPAAP